MRMKAMRWRRIARRSWRFGSVPLARRSMSLPKTLLRSASPISAASLWVVPAALAFFVNWRNPLPDRRCRSPSSRSELTPTVPARSGWEHAYAPIRDRTDVWPPCRVISRRRHRRPELRFFAYSSVGSLRHTVELHLRQMVELSLWRSRCPPWHSNLAPTGLPTECQVYEDFASCLLYTS